ncbi:MULTISPECIES: serine hydrolase [Gammaproteobacteria]|uniref:serine hydrolase domain-containing protein n=1 Tax=Gammaproteobacteria TaxID=1236 RepID=UPI000DD03FF0|nr:MULTISPECIES: serine hydrolase [Gammaproteobacteria]RTE85884.1 class C beta-lactamase-related serine hydrolase [Aliidiomarina sp. B3213]TCZ90115.1 class C beta-lactamase-related serine hydrolase [Lysobacter sp. N42]
MVKGMQLARFSLLLGFCLFLAGCSLQQAPEPRYISPEVAGFDDEKLQQLTEIAEEAGSSSIVLMHEGQIVYSYGDIFEKHTIHSIRKSMLNSIFGIYVERGMIDLDATIDSLDLDDIHGLSELEKSATVRQLLQARSGIYHPSAATSAGMLRNIPERNSVEPGTQYVYNNWDFNVAGAIFEQQTGLSIYKAFLEEIAKPIGMRQYQGDYVTYQEGDELGEYEADGFYMHEPELSKYPDYHFRMSAYDMALYGQLYLNGGMWNGEQIIPQGWIEESTTSYSVTNPYMDFGYGYLWNVINPNEERATKSFYHTGVGVHMLAVYPGSDFVFVHRVQTEEGVEFNQQNLYRLIGAMFSAKD